MIELSISRSIEVREKLAWSRALKIWFAISMKVRVKKKNVSDKINLKNANDWKFVEFLKNSRECVFEKLNERFATFSSLMIVFLNSSRSMIQTCDQEILFENFDDRVFRNDLSVIDEFFLTMSKTKFLIFTDTRSSNLWLIRKKFRNW